jgi:hypothetical protein
MSIAITIAIRIISAIPTLLETMSEDCRFISKSSELFRISNRLIFFYPISQIVSELRRDSQTFSEKILQFSIQESKIITKCMHHHREQRYSCLNEWCCRDKHLFESQWERTANVVSLHLNRFEVRSQLNYQFESLFNQIDIFQHFSTVFNIF